MKFEPPMNSLLEFTSNLIEEIDGAVEWSDTENSFQALLPDHVRHRLGMPESLVTISDGTCATEEPGGIPIGFGTELLERAIPMAFEIGRTASVRMPPISSRKQPDLEPGRYFSFPNATFKEKGDHESWLDYWLWSFDVAADADERREEVHHVCISSAGVGCPELPELILYQASDWEPLKIRASEFTDKKLDTLFIVACDRALRGADESLAEFKETVTRHHVRDIRRIESYFQDLSAEMEDEIQRRQLKGADLEIRREKINQLAGEKSRKLSALRDKYKLRLTFRPLALLLARLPVRRFDLLVKRRKRQRRLNLVYNLLSKRFDPMACEACGADTYRLGFCDDALHILCAACLSMYTSRKECPRCRGKRPPSKIEGVLRRLGIEEGGQKQL
jgi:hypothetical protein